MFEKIWHGVFLIVINVALRFIEKILATIHGILKLRAEEMQTQNSENNSLLAL